ncbi:unnamed protein product [Haemonchus placei]|uniref:Splicing factor 3B subunit 5 n=1 Tax=Haemonchus placei TaxID=6290 RepID=A0A0N4WVT2_HAEPC|nr:unnamed protein product [Haemonchus placei]
MSGPGERFHVLAQLDHLHSKYTGTGHADTTRYEWLTNQLRDTRASQVFLFSFFLLLELT